MRFSNMEDDTLRVTFSGDNVSDGELTPAPSPVVLQMDGGGGEYSAVKYTTASVSVLCDGLQLLELYASRPLDVSVDVVNDTTGELLFAGYVSPNTYNQQLTGINDTLTIECVDYLGSAKFMPYTLIDAIKGFSSITIRAVIEHIASIIGASDVFFNDFVELENKNVKIAEYEELQLLESYFFESSVEPDVLPDGTPSFMPLAKTCFDVLDMIGASFRATFFLVGKDIFFSDQLSAIEPQKNSFRLGSQYFNVGNLLLLEEEGFTNNSASVSVLPRPSLFTLSLPRGEGIALTPSFLSPSLLSASSENIEETTSDSEVLVQLLDSLACDLEVSADKAPSAPSSRIIAYRKIAGTGEPNGENASWLDKKFPWERALRLYLPKNMSTRVKLCAFKKKFSQSAIAGGHWALNLSIKVAFSMEVNFFAPLELDSSKMYELFLKIRCGNKYLYGNEWRETPIDIPSTENRLVFSEESEWRTKFYAYDAFNGWGFNFSNLVIALPGGEIEVELWGGVASSSGISQWRVCFLKEFEVKMVRSDLLHSYTTYLPTVLKKGEYSFSNAAKEVELPLQFGVPGGPCPLSTRIDGEEFVEIDAGYLPQWRLVGELKFRQGHTMIDRVAALGNFGDGIELELPLRDEHNNSITPLTAISSSQWQGNKVVVAYSKDLAESTAIVTLN